MLFQDIDYEGFRKFLNSYLEIDTPDELCRHLFLSFVRKDSRGVDGKAFKVWYCIFRLIKIGGVINVTNKVSRLLMWVIKQSRAQIVDAKKRKSLKRSSISIARGAHCRCNNITLERKKHIASYKRAFGIKRGKKRYSRKRVRQELKAAYYPRLLLSRRWLCSLRQPPVPQLHRIRLPAVTLIALAYPAELPRRSTVDLRWLTKYTELRKNCKHWVITEWRTKSLGREPVKNIFGAIILYWQLIFYDS